MRFPVMGQIVVAVSSAEPRIRQPFGRSGLIARAAPWRIRGGGPLLSMTPLP